MSSHTLPCISSESPGRVAIDRELRNQLALLIRESRQDSSSWWLANDLVWHRWQQSLSAAACGCGYPRTGLVSDRCPECGRVPDIGLNQLLRSIQLMDIDSEDFEHQRRLGAHAKREAREFWARLVLFLQSDAAQADPADEPMPTKFRWREAICLTGAAACFPPLNILFFGLAGLLLTPLLFVFWHLSTCGKDTESPKHLELNEHWPFATPEDLSLAKLRLRYLTGTAFARS